MCLEHRCIGQRSNGFDTNSVGSLILDLVDEISDICWHVKEPSIGLLGDLQTHWPLAKYSFAQAIAGNLEVFYLVVSLICSDIALLFLVSLHSDSPSPALSHTFSTRRVLPHII